MQLQKDFEDDKQQAVARALSNMQREIERVRRQTTERSKEQCMDEMKKLAQKHKENISYIKKKQWVSSWAFWIAGASFFFFFFFFFFFAPLGIHINNCKEFVLYNSHALTTIAEG